MIETTFQCRYHEAWNKVFREAIKHTIKNHSGNELSSVLTRVFEWEAIENMSDLQRKLEEDAKPPCANCNKSLFDYTTRNIQQAVIDCLQKIQGMKLFSTFWVLNCWRLYLQFWFKSPVVVDKFDNVACCKVIVRCFNIECGTNVAFLTQWKGFRLQGDQPDSHCWSAYN